MLSNIYTFVIYSPPQTVIIVLISLLIGMSFSIYPIVRKKPIWVISAVWGVAFLTFFTLSANSIGSSYKLNKELKKEMCNVYKDSRFDIATQTCYIKYISKRNVPIEIKLKDHSFKVIKD